MRKEYILKIVKAINNINTRLTILIMELSEKNSESFFIEYSVLKQERFVIEQLLDDILLSEINLDEDGIENDLISIIEKYSSEEVSDDVYTDVLFEYSIRDFLEIKKSETQNLENRIKRYNKQIEIFAPTFVKDLEAKLVCESSYHLNEINKILKRIAIERKNYIQ